MTFGVYSSTIGGHETSESRRAGRRSKWGHGRIGKSRQPKIRQDDRKRDDREEMRVDEDMTIRAMTCMK